MSCVIKEEPVEIEESQRKTNLGLIDQKYESELVYLKNVSDKILVDQDLDLENFQLDQISETLIRTENNMSPSNVLCKISDNKIDNTTRKIKKKELGQEKISLEKKLVLSSLANSAKADQNLDSNLSKYELINADEEAYYLSLLNKYLEDENVNDPALVRLRAKLKMRSLKRKNHSKVFDIDSYVNELIDQEKIKMINQIKQRKLKPDLSENLENGQIVFDNENNNDCVDDDVIFESAASLQTSDNSEIIEIKRVLDRFKNKKLKSFHHETELRVHMVEARREDVKCLISPYSNQIVRPFVWKDFRSLPKKLRLHKEIMERMRTKFDRVSIDYVHLRPEHVIPINAMCREHFWAGIDVSECLEYPDYAIVALYRKLIIGFALLVPNCTLKEAYLSFILVHPDWRTDKTAAVSSDVSVAKFLIYYLIQKCFDCDISLHVSVNSPAVIFYQKFGFQIVEYIKNFYDKYYSDELNLSKDAFLMKYTRN